MATGYEGGFTRRQELTCTETEMAAYADVVLYENEHIYVKMNSGMIRLKIGDGKTGLLNLPWAKVFDATLDDVEAIVGGFANRVETNTKRIENLEAAISPEIVTPVTDSTVAYSKTVPNGALPNAAVTEIGGMTYVKNGVLVDSKVEAVESMGLNLLDMSKLDNLTSYGVVFTKNNEGKYVANGTATNRIQIHLTSVICDNSTKLWLSGGQSGVQITVNAKLNGSFMKNIGTVQGSTVQLSQGINYDEIEIYLIIEQGKSLSNVTFYAMLNKGSTALPYSPYFREALPIPEAVRNLDGYGQSVNEQYCNKIVLNPAEGVKKFVKRVKKITVNAENITMLATENYYGHPVALTDISTDGAILDGLPKYGITSIPSYDVSQGSYYWITDKSIGVGNKQLTICDSTFATIDDFKALCPFDVVYVVEITETDVSHLFTADNLLPVEAGGTITAVNEFEHEVPFTVKYMIKGA